MLYASPAGHGSSGATWLHWHHSHIQSSTPSPLSRLPLGSTTPPPSAGACASGTPRPASCPPEANTSDGFSLAPSALGATAASACAISSPAPAPLPGASGAAPSPPAAVRWYAFRACASSSLMSGGPAVAASCAAFPACSPAVGLPMGPAPCIPCVGGVLGQGMRVHHMLVRTVMVMVMVKVDGVPGHSRRVMVMVKVDGELWHSRRVYVLVWEVMLHHGEPDGVMK